MSMILGVQPDVPTETNERGGKQLRHALCLSLSAAQCHIRRREGCKIRCREVRRNLAESQLQRDSPCGGTA